MTRPRRIPMMVAATVIWLGTAGASTAGVRAGIGVTISPHAGLGVWIGSVPVRPVVVAPPRYVSIARPGYGRFGRLGPPRYVPVVVPPPVIRPIVIPGPPVYEVTVTSITVWITNSNGSRTSVKLIRQGPYYIGPRGEYYTTIPTNEQLRVVYGF